MRLFRALPAAGAVVLLLLAGSALLSAVQPHAAAARPADEVLLVYFAMMYEPEPPDQLSNDDLRGLLATLDPEAERIAERLELAGYERHGRSFRLDVRHRGDGRTYTVTPGGIS